MGVFKRMFLAGLGTMSLSKEKAEAIVDELVKAGQIKEKEGRKLLDEMLQKAETLRKEVEQKVSSQAKVAYGKLNLATLEQMKKMEKRIQQLERELAKKTGAQKTSKGKK